MMKKFLILILLLTTCLIVGADQYIDGDFSPWEYWRMGFESFEKGQQFHKSKKYKKALDAYLKAKEYFLKVKKDKPDWNQTVIDERISLCSARIKSLNLLIDAMEPEEDVSLPAGIPDPRPVKKSGKLPEDDFNFSGSGTPTRTIDSVKEKAMQDELNQYKEKLFTALVKLEEYRTREKRSSNALAEIESLMKEKSELNQKYLLLLEEYTKLKKNASSPDGEKNILKNKLVEAKIQSDVLNQKIKMYQAEIQKLQEQVNKLEQTKRSATFKTGAAEQQVSDFEEKLKRAQQKMEEYRLQAEKSSADSAKLKYITEIQQTQIDRYKKQIEKLSKWMDGTKTSQGGKIDREIARENLKLEKDLTEQHEEYEKLEKENLLLKNKLRDEYASQTKLKEMINSLELQRRETEKNLQVLKKHSLAKSQVSEAHAGDLEKLQQENAKLKNELRIFAENMGDSKTSSGADNTIAAKYKAIVEKLNLELAEAQTKLKQLELAAKENSEKYSKLETENESLKDTNVDLTQANKNLNEVVKNYNQLVKQVEELKKAGQAAEKLQSELAQNRKANDELQKKLKTLEPLAGKAEEYKKLEAELATHKKRVAELEANYSALKNQAEAKSGLDKKYADLQKTHAALKLEKEKLSQQVTELGRKADAIRKLEDENAKLTGQLGDANNKKLGEKDKLKELLDRKEEHLKVSQQKIDKYESEVAAKNAQIEDLLKQLNANRNKIAELERGYVGKQTVDKVLPPGKLSDSKIAFLITEGVKSETNNDYEAAEWHYKKVLSDSPNNGEANRRLGMLYLSRGKPEEAVRYLEKALRTAPEDTDLLVAFAVALAHEGKNQNALKVLNQVLSKSPDNVAAMLATGSVYSDMKQSDKAEQLFKKVLQVRPKSAEANLRLAYLLSENPKRKADALKCYDQALQLGAKPDALLDKILKGKADKNESEAVRTLAAMAVQHESKKDYVAAAWCYSQLTAMEPENYKFRERYGYVLMRQNRFDVALPELEKAHKLEPENLTCLLLLGANYVISGKNAEALKVYEQAGKMLDKDPKYKLPDMVSEFDKQAKEKLQDKQLKTAYEKLMQRLNAPPEKK